MPPVPQSPALPSPTVELDATRLAAFCDALAAGAGRRIERPDLWAAFAGAFPGRPQGPEQRHWFLAALTAAAERGVIVLPSVRGKRWDRSLMPFVPDSVDRVREPVIPAPSTWKTDPWTPALAWVADLATLDARDYAFLQRVQHGLVHGAFAEAAPFKYRSLELTGDEKRLGKLVTRQLFQAGRLTLALLNCLPEQLPIAWEAVDSRSAATPGRVLVFENHAVFTLALRTLRASRAPQYEIVAFGSGKAVGRSIGWLAHLGRPIASIDYVGDLDWEGLDAPRLADASARALGLPRVRPATHVHQAMLNAATAFGAPDGWPHDTESRSADPATCLAWLAPEIRSRVASIVRAGRRIPEEVLGPRQMRDALAAADAPAVAPDSALSRDADSILR